MKALYDKILLVVGLLALAGGIAFFLMRSGEVRSADALLTQQPSGSAYSEVQPPAILVDNPVWGDPQAQDTEGLQVYDIFTPPQIFWDPIAGELVFKPVTPVEPLPDFGLQLVKIERDLFRVQLEAFFLAQDGSMEESIVQFYNTKLGESIRGKMGDKFPEHGFEVINVTYPLIVDDIEGTMRRVPTVVIADLEQDGRQVTLTTESKLFLEGKLTILMRTLDPYAPAEFKWAEIGDTHQSNDATFTLLDFNFDNNSVNVEKAAPYLDPSEVRTLYETQPETITQTTPESSSGDNQQPNNSSLPEGFENLFN
ncbi:hypothetical protein [Rubellicoccus peritrichatus]|uniref:Uncharacterized protein n=1 Tax=Rubellicoccus peritrichatus TaxID=3080537 RepID=A0AAQ3LGT3_9BACT|nr:hypothetical protein [Puniceicoccus sp. CR14]WOO41884.1 hypothetical protein RZN69_02205 [Puniceicoccus sp. CR14]